LLEKKRRQEEEKRRQEEEDERIANQLYLKEIENTPEPETRYTNDDYSYSYTRDENGERHTYSSHYSPPEEIPSYNNDVVEDIDVNNLDLSNYEDVSRLSERIGVVKVGLTDHQIQNLPFFLYKEHYKIDREDTCPICRDDWEVDQEITRLNCFHLFHKQCIGTWFKQSKKCPVCKYEVIL